MRGGCGKTRLALQAAADLLEEFTDGVFFVDLAPITDPGLVVPTIAQTLEVRESGGQPLLQILKRSLREKQLLLVLDNFEQVLDAAPVVAELLAAAPRLKVLVTSREILRLRGECAFPVPPLSLPDPRRLPSAEALSQYPAVALFVERAAAVRPGFAVTPENAPALVEICRRLDGLPLALELAASRIRLFSPQALLARLEKRLPLLVGGPRDLPARQQALRSAIAWSYELLDEAEKALFRRLAVFVGGFTLEAVSSVCVLPASEGSARAPGEVAVRADPLTADAVLDEVVSLLDKNLLRQEEGLEGEPRFRTLETIREFAWECLEASGEADAIRQQHARFFGTLAQEARPHLGRAKATQGERPPSIWLERLEREHDNLRAALDWLQQRGEVAEGLHLAVALSPFWDIRGYGSEGLRRLLAALALTDPSDRSDLRAEALYIAGMLAYSRGDSGTARRLFEESLAIRRDRGDWVQIGHSLRLLGFVASDRQGDFRAARALLEESLAAFEQAGDPETIAYGLGGLGILIFAQGDQAAGRALWERVLAIQRERGDRPEIARAFERLTLMADEQGDYPAACAYLQERLSLLRELARQQGIALPPAGRPPERAGRWDGAALRALWEEEVTICRAISGETGMARYGICRDLLLEQGEYATARALYEESLVRSRETDALHEIARCLRSLGTIAHRQGDCEKAHALLEESLALSLETGLPSEIMRARIALGSLASDQGDFVTAEALLQEHLTPFREMDRRKDVAHLLSLLGTLARRQGDLKVARERLEESLAMQREIGFHPGLALALAGLGRLHLDRNDPAAARELLAESLAIRQRRCDRPGIAECLEGLAAAAHGIGELERAAQRLGAAAAVREAIGAPIPPADRAAHERHVAAIRAALGEAAFAAAWEKGHAMSLEQAVALALDEPGDG